MVQIAALLRAEYFKVFQDSEPDEWPEIHWKMSTLDDVVAEINARANTNTAGTAAGESEK